VNAGECAFDNGNIEPALDEICANKTSAKLFKTQTLGNKV